MCSRLQQWGSPHMGAETKLVRPPDHSPTGLLNTSALSAVCSGETQLQRPPFFLVFWARFRAARKLLCGGGMAWAPGEGGGGGVPEMGFCAGPFVLCKDGCCRQRRRNTNFGPENFFSRKNVPPHMCSQNDQHDVGIILSHVCWGRPPPPPGTAGRAAPAHTPLPARRPRRGRGGLEKWASVPYPPCKAIFFPPSFS